MSAETPAAAAPNDASALPRTYASFAIFALSLVLALAFVFGHQQGGAARFTPDKWLNKDGTFYYLTLRTLVDHHTLAQDNTQPRSWYEQELRWNHTLNADWSDVAVGRDGHWYPKHPILLPLVTVPLWYAFDAYGALILNLLCLALLPLLAYRIALKMAPWGAALAAAALFGSSAFLTEQAYGYSNDLFYGVLVLLAFERAFSEKPISSGFWFSLAVFAKATNAILLIPLALVWLLKKDIRGVIRFAVGAAPGILLFAGLNWWMYGAPWHTGYNHILVRQNGVQGFHDHAQDFDWAHWWQWVKARLVAPNGSNTFNMWDRAAFWFLAAPGALVALVRAPKIAIPLLLAIVMPIALLAPFQFFRVEFLNGQVGLSVAFIATLLVPWVKAPKPEPARVSKVRWDRLGPVIAILVLLVASGIRMALPKPGDFFVKHLADAKVTLGPVPCDYFNWQGQRWECSNFDRGQDDLMTGLSLNGLPQFGGQPFASVSLAPHPMRAPRRIAYDMPLSQKLEVRYGLRDGTQPRGHEQLNLLVNGQPTELPLSPPGVIATQTIDTSALAGKNAEIALEVSSDAGGDAPVYFDGKPL